MFFYNISYYIVEGDNLKILKYKKQKNNQYLVEFDSNTLELYEEVILETELLLKKEITKGDYDYLLKKNQYWSCYYTALRYLKVRMRSRFEVENKLLKDQFSKEDIASVTQKLMKQGYLNDLIYANSFFHEQTITTNRGPRRIQDELRKKGIDSAIIQEVLSTYDEDLQRKKVQKIVSKIVKANHNKSNQLLKRKIYMDLLKEGFSKNIIDYVITNQEFPKEEDIRSKEYDKIKKRLSRKYNGEELERKVKEQMIKKGFYSSF